MQCYVILSENLIQEFSVPFGQLDRLEVWVITLQAPRQIWMNLANNVFVVRIVQDSC